MTQWRLSRSARQDLDEIWDYIAVDDPIAADGVIDGLLKRLRLLADQPGVGRPRDELAPHLRSLAVGKYIIFYRRHGNGIDVVRILSGYRDVLPLISPGN